MATPGEVSEVSDVSASASVGASAGRSTRPSAVVAGFLDHLLVERGVAENTLRSYRRDLCRYTEYMPA